MKQNLGRAGILDTVFLGPMFLGAVFLGVVLFGSPSWAEPKGSGLKTTRIEDLSPEKRKKVLWQLEKVNTLRAYKRGKASKEGALKEMSELAACSVLFEIMANVGARESGHRDQKTIDGLLLYAKRAERTGLFFVKKYFDAPEVLMSTNKRAAMQTFKELDLTTAHDKAQLAGVRDDCVKKATLMALVRSLLEKADSQKDKKSR